MQRYSKLCMLVLKGQFCLACHGEFTVNIGEIFLDGAGAETQN